MISWPDPIEAISRPPITGSNWSPDAVGLAPFTTWRNSGRYVTDPKSAKPTISPTRLVVTKTLLRKSESGSTGSAARRSANTNAQRLTTPITPSPTISGEPHAYSEPPRVVSSTIALRPAASSPVPR